MADTRPNINVPAGQAVDLYAATATHPQGAIPAGAQISITMLGTGSARLYSGASLATPPSKDTGYDEIFAGEQMINDVGDAGAFIWSVYGCSVNVREV